MASEILPITLFLFVAFLITTSVLADDTAAPSWRVEELGVPVTAVTYANSHGVLAAGPGGDGEMFYTSYYCNTGAELVGYDFRRRKGFRRKLGSQGGYGVTVGLDGSVYIGGVAPGNLYRYDPKTDTLTTIDVKQFGVQYIWDAATAPDGTIYCAAGYPKTKLVAYDPESGEARDLGELVPTQKYLRSVCVDAYGKVWCGIGTRAHLVVYDPSDDSREHVLPKAYASSSSVYRLQPVGRYVVANVSLDGVLLVYDAETKEVLREIRRPDDDVAWVVANGGTDRTVYVEAWPSYRFYKGDLADGSLSPLPVRFDKVMVVEDDRWVHAMDDQDYVVYDLHEKREVTRTPLTEGGDGMAIYALTGGPDGNVYGSTYINMHLFRCEAATDALTDLGKCSRWAGQVDSLSLGHDGRIYIGAYVHAVMSVYEPGAPWKPGREPDSNPREIGPLGKGQYRTKANCLGPGGNIYVGSIPSYNSAPTGAFSICNPATGEMDVRTDFVKGGAVHAVVADDRYVYGAGGGEFFVYNPAADEKRFTAVRPVTALAVINDGKVVGSGGGKLFVYDREANEIVAETPNPAGDFTHMATDAQGRAYGVNKGHVARVGDGGTSVTVLANEGGQFCALDSEGRVYFARGPKLFRCGP